MPRPCCSQAIPARRSPAPVGRGGSIGRGRGRAVEYGGKDERVGAVVAKEILLRPVCEEPVVSFVTAYFANHPACAAAPVNVVSWGDVARFSNWMQNGQPTGAQDLTTTEDGSYYLNGAMTDAALLAGVGQRTGDRVQHADDDRAEALVDVLLRRIGDVPRRIPAGETISRVEAPRGELLYYIKSNGTDRPERIKVRTLRPLRGPSFSASVSVGSIIRTAQ